jgi:hypothetical protein
MDEKPRFLDNFENVRLLVRIFVGICIGVFALDLVYEPHAEHAWENLFGFYCIFGFVACVALVLGAKEMRKVLMRREDYYDD